ncbi:MAG: dienelactone hydrolase family protein [Haliscomenobacteraceae bacterium CHB4]|nr:dienelactone hydrolase family protein [Haliscomenobacteraceae bacterium CHB4]
MRIILLFALLLVLGSFYILENRQDDNLMVMCHDPNNALDAFAAFADDKAFRAAHPSPLPTEVTHAGTMVEFPVEGGPNGKAFLVKAHGKTDKYLIILQEWWGLNDFVKNEAAKWSHELGINVIAPDLYDGKVATDADQAGKLMQGADNNRLSAIIQGAAKYAGDKADFRTLGWCFGGGWSLQTALLLKDKMKACVMYYGMPEKDVEKLKTLSTDVIFIHASKDKWINDEVVSGFENNIKAAGKNLTVHRYDADHAFANPSSPRYNEQAAKDSRAVVKAYLQNK